MINEGSIMESVAINRKVARIIRATAETGRLLWAKGWAEKNAGNISINVSAIMSVPRDRSAGAVPRKLPSRFPSLKGQVLLVTQTGSRMRDLARDPETNLGLVRISASGAAYQVVWSGRDPRSFEPTSEFPTHLAIHNFFQARRRPNRAILHTHPDELIALTHSPAFRDEAAMNRLLRGLHPEIELFLPRGVGLTPFRKPGSQALGKATVKALSGHDIVLWPKHGCLATGENILEVFDLIDILNKAARIYFLCMAAGFSMGRP
jgi:rhamnulose-1-phosphate aldolase